MNVNDLPVFARPMGVALIRAMDEVRPLPIKTEPDRIRRADALAAALARHKAALQ